MRQIADALPHNDTPANSSMRKVIFASSLGTVFEWYDFYLYGSLAAVIAKQFFSGLNETSAYIAALLAFAAGFAVRPFGALVFGRLGDLVGRKYTFLVTIVIMGLSTFVVGVLPVYSSIGVAAPVTLIVLRMLQGLALGGEYGGAATYVAEHSSDENRGFNTSFIQVTATAGLFLSLVVILACRLALKDDFDIWGWRIPFLMSSLLLGISVYIRLQLNESPLFQKMKVEGKQSKAPLTEAFGHWRNLKIVILALLGATAGQAVVWYTGQFYSLFFLTAALKIDPTTANILVAVGLAIATPFFVVFGWLSDKIGRKKVVMAGCLLAALTYFPIFKGLTHYGNPALETAAATSPVSVVADPEQCSFQFDPIGKKVFTSACDIAKSFLAKNAIPYGNVVGPAGSVAQIKVGSTVIDSFDGSALGAAPFKAQQSAFAKRAGDALTMAGYPKKADPAAVTMVYGPIAAWLVELFPTRIRYTSMSLPYHIGNGWFGGFVPSIAFAMVATHGDIYYGLWYPIGVALMTLIIGTLFLRETRGSSLSL